MALILHLVATCSLLPQLAVGLASCGKARPCSQVVNSELSTIISTLWQLDRNRLASPGHYKIDVQGHTKPGQRGDRAQRPLFSSLSEDNVFARPTYRTFRQLVDNYEAAVGRCEVVTDAEKRENGAFLEAILSTDVMKEAHRYLSAKKKTSDSVDAFRKLLDDIWFGLYRRGKGNCDDSSGFEHVFIGETRGGRVIGLHNWIQFYLQEKAGRIDYQGYVSKDLGLMSLQFKWRDLLKPVTSLFVGTSPEFELALYTIVFLCAGNETVLNINDTFLVGVVSHRLGDRSQSIGTIYPEALHS